MIPTTPWRFTTEAVYSESKNDCIDINLPWVSDLGEKGTCMRRKKVFYCQRILQRKGRQNLCKVLGQVSEKVTNLRSDSEIVFRSESAVSGEVAR